MDDDDNFTDIFQRYRVDIVQGIDTEKQFMFSYLRSKFVLDDEDCERINHCVTRPEKVSKMLDILALKGPDAVQHFVDAVEFDHPKLYEKITGKKAESRISSVSDDLTDCIMNWTNGLDGKALIDFDRQFLSKQLDRAMTDLKCMTYWQTKILEEKTLLERKLYEAADDLQMKDKNMQDLKEKIIEFASERRAAETEEDALQTQQPMQLYLQELWQDNMERSNVIIALQGRLLVATEQLDKLKKVNFELEEKTGSFKNRVRELTIVYDHEKRNSRKLNETMMSHTTETDVLKKGILQWKYDYYCVVDEKDSLQTELDNVHKWGEILNTRFDHVKQEKSDLEENSEDLCSRLRSMKTNCKKMEVKVTWTEFNNETLKSEVERMKETIKLLRENRASVNVAREAALLSRNNALREKATMESSLKALQQKHEEEREKQMRMYEAVESKHCQALLDLDRLEQALSDEKKELLNVKLDLEQIRCNSDEEAVKKGEPADPSRCSENRLNPGSNESDVTDGVQSAWHKRSHKDLIESIRRKMCCSSKQGNTLPANWRAGHGLLDYEHLSLIYPQQFNRADNNTVAAKSIGLTFNNSAARVGSNTIPRNFSPMSPCNSAPCALFSFAEQNDKSKGTRQIDISVKQTTAEVIKSPFERHPMQHSLSLDDPAPFRDRLYCMEPDEGILIARSRTLSSPAIVCNKINNDGSVKKSSTT